MKENIIAGLINLIFSAFSAVPVYYLYKGDKLFLAMVFLIYAVVGIKRCDGDDLK